MFASPDVCENKTILAVNNLRAVTIRNNQSIDRGVESQESAHTATLRQIRSSTKGTFKALLCRPATPSRVEIAQSNISKS